MSGNLAEWIIILAFFITVIVAMFAEAVLLSRKSWATFGRAFAFSALSNFIGLSVGLFVFFVVMAVFMMLSLDGTAQRIFESSFGGAAIGVLVFAAIFTPILLIICKRVFLAILKIQTGKSAWLYSLASSVLIVAASLGIPILIGYVLFR